MGVKGCKFPNSESVFLIFIFKKFVVPIQNTQNNLKIAEHIALIASYNILPNLK